MWDMENGTDDAGTAITGTKNQVHMLNNPYGKKRICKIFTYCSTNRQALHLLLAQVPQVDVADFALP